MVKIRTKITIFLFLSGFLFISCTSTTTIDSIPSGAKLYLDDQIVGNTPYLYSDTKTIGAVTRIKIEKNGYKTFRTTMTRNEKLEPAACAGGVFFLIPLIWVQGYYPAHTYELEK